MTGCTLTYVRSEGLGWGPDGDFGLPMISYAITGPEMMAGQGHMIHMPLLFDDAVGTSAMQVN